MNKNVVITGSTRGLGKEMARKFLELGCHVTISGRGEVMLETTVQELKAFEDQYIYVPCNVQNSQDLQSLWDKSVSKWGGVDIWINNAGLNSPDEYAWDTDEQSMRHVIDTNITGMILGCQISAVNMIKQCHGAIYSMEGLGSNNMIQPKTILYGTTKHALTYFMKGLAKELNNTGIIAGRLSPGMMLTDFITKGEDGQESHYLNNERFKRIFNILGDRPETVAEFLVPKMLENKKNDAHIMWLTNRKVFGRFLTSSFKKRELL